VPDHKSDCLPDVQCGDCVFNRLGCYRKVVHC
jgi:hypothetical protein